MLRHLAVHDAEPVRLLNGETFARGRGVPQLALVGVDARAAHRVWVSPGRFISLGYGCRQNEVTSTVSVPLDTPTSALARYVQEATEPLFTAFSGFELPYKGIEKDTRRVLERKW